MISTRNVLSGILEVLLFVTLYFGVSKVRIAD